MALADLKTLYRNLRIKYKLLVLISAVIATFGILIVVVQQYAFEVYDREIYEQSSAALNQTAAAIENELRKVQQQSYRMAIDEVIQEQLRKIKDAGSDYDRYLASYQIRERIVLLGGLDNHVRSVQLIDAHGGEYSVGKAPVLWPAGSGCWRGRPRSHRAATRGLNRMRKTARWPPPGSSARTSSSAWKVSAFWRSGSTCTG